MSCTRCGAALAETDDACPACGAPREATGAAQATPQPGEFLWNAAGNVVRAAARAEERLRDPALADRIPGRSLAVVGYAALEAAILLDMLPFDYRGRFVSVGWDVSRLGHFWDVVLMVLAVAALGTRLLTARGSTVPLALTKPALPALVAALAAAQAYLLLDVSLIPMLLLAAAVILVYDAARSGLLRGGADAFERLAAGVPNATVTGIALVLAALLVSWIPGRTRSFLGGVVVLGSDPTGTLWGLVVLAGGAAAIALASGALGADERIARWFVGAYVLLVTAWAVVLFNLSLVPLLWLAGASLAAYDQYRKAYERTGGALSLRRLTVGPRRLVLAGVPLCLVAMSFTWSTVAGGGYFMGGYTSTYSSYYGGYVSDYSLTKYYMPGFSASNTGLTQGPGRFSFSPLVVAALLALVVLALWVSARPVPRWAYVLPAAIVAVVGLWTLAHLGGHWGPWVFLAGLALLGVAAFSVALPTVREYSAARGTTPQPTP